MDEVISKIRGLIDRNALITKGDRVLLSLSAGKDSMLLYQSMKLFSKEYGIEIGIFHLNHLTRGRESARDEAHLANLAGTDDIPIYIERFDFTANRKQGVSFEEHARNVRYALAGEISASHGYNKIATGHNKNDNIETILMRIFTGTGLYGLEGIKARRDNIIRPLLALTADEIYSYLTINKIPWREDRSNADTDYLRNFTRHKILPLIRSRFPMADESIASLSGLAGEAVHLLDMLVEENNPSLYHASGADLYINAYRLIGNAPLFRHVVKVGLKRFFNHHVNRKMLDEIYAKFTINRSNIRLYKNDSILMDKIFNDSESRLKISKNTHAAEGRVEWEYPLDLSVPGSRQDLYLSEIGIRISVEITNYGKFEKFHKNAGYVFVALENKVKSIYIRNRRAGDKIKPGKGTKKIKDLLIEKKLDNDSKNLVPLLVSESGVIAYMPGFLFDISNRVAADFLIDKKMEEVLVVYKN
jgi:tRNA(Ile)-lysidine synthase